MTDLSIQQDRQRDKLKVSRIVVAGPVIGFNLNDHPEKFFLSSRLGWPPKDHSRTSFGYIVRPQGKVVIPRAASINRGSGDQKRTGIDSKEIIAKRT
jgi:hypothetical protein